MCTVKFLKYPFNGFLAHSYTIILHLYNKMFGGSVGYQLNNQVFL